VKLAVAVDAASVVVVGCVVAVVVKVACVAWEAETEAAGDDDSGDGGGG
jgi:hypothetical protein